MASKCQTQCMQHTGTSPWKLPFRKTNVSVKQLPLFISAWCLYFSEQRSLTNVQVWNINETALSGKGHEERRHRRKSARKKGSNLLPADLRTFHTLQNCIYSKFNSTSTCSVAKSMAWFIWFFPSAQCLRKWIASFNIYTSQTVNELHTYLVALISLGFNQPRREQ